MLQPLIWRPAVVIVRLDHVCINNARLIEISKTPLYEVKLPFIRSIV